MPHTRFSHRFEYNITVLPVVVTNDTMLSAMVTRQQITFGGEDGCGIDNRDCSCTVVFDPVTGTGNLQMIGKSVDTDYMTRLEFKCEWDVSWCGAGVQYTTTQHLTLYGTGTTSMPQEVSQLMDAIARYTIYCTRKKSNWILYATAWGPSRPSCPTIDISTPGSMMLLSALSSRQMNDVAQR